jgi:hypothetical protein
VRLELQIANRKMKIANSNDVELSRPFAICNLQFAICSSAHLEMQWFPCPGI